LFGLEADLASVHPDRSGGELVAPPTSGGPSDQGAGGVVGDSEPRDDRISNLGTSRIGPAAPSAAPGDDL